MEPVSGVIESVTKLCALGHSLLGVTSRGGIELEIAEEWSHKKGLDLNFIDIVPHLFMFSWGYNKYIDVGGVIRRIGSWEEFCKTIESL